MSEIRSIVYSPRNLPAEPHDHYQRVPVAEADLLVGRGLRGDRKGGSPKRQLNLMSAEALDALAQQGFQTGPGQMGEQIVLAGLDFAALAPGTRLQLGSAATIEFIKDRTGCERFEHIQGHSPSEAAGRMGVMARVVTRGHIAVGDPVRLLAPEAA